MPVHQCTTEEIPILKGNQEKVVERILKLRNKLEDMFWELNSVASVIIVCCGQLREQNVEADIEVERMLRLHKIIEKLGGTTEFSESDEDDEDDKANQVLMAFGAGGADHI